MPYKLKELLDTLQAKRAIALYLVDGFVPALIVDNRPVHAEFGLDRTKLTSCSIFALQGPTLNREEMHLVLEEIKTACDGDGDCGYGKHGFTEFRYNKESYDCDIFVFANESRMTIEFRKPYT